MFTLPLFHRRGVNILIQSFDPDLILDLIAREGVTVFFGVPTMFQMLIESAKFASTNFSTVRFMVSGGAQLGLYIIETFKTQKSIRIWEGYGLTEVGPNNFMANGKPGTLGHPMPFVDVKIVDSDDNEVGAGTQGEIFLRGPHACAGYWNKPDASKKAFKDGWFRTGDLGRVDADGHYSIVGRLKDMIISGGANIYPAEIERVIETHPAVVGAAVIGVPHADLGETVLGLIVPQPGAAPDLDAMAAAMVERGEDPEAPAEPKPAGPGGLATASGMGAVATVLLTLLRSGDHVVGTDTVYGPTRLLVENELSRFGARRGKAHTVYDVVETALEKTQQVLTGRAFQLCRLLVVVAELTLQHTVHATELLFFAKLHAVVRQSRTALRGATRGHLQLALRLERANAALQKQIRAFAAGQFTFWS